MEPFRHITPTIVASAQDSLEIGMHEDRLLALFWAPWCHPCRLQKPVVDALATDYRGRVKFVEVNIDQRPEVAIRFGVQSIPTLILFKGKKEIKRFIGLQEKKRLSEAMETIL